MPKSDGWKNVGNQHAPKDFWKIGPAKRRSKAFIATALEREFVKNGDDTLIKAIAEGAAKGDARLIQIACDYRWGKPKKEVEHRHTYEDKSLDQLLGLLPEALKALSSAGLDVAVAAKLTGGGNEAATKGAEGERPSVSGEDVVEGLPPALPPGPSSDG